MSGVTKSKAAARRVALEVVGWGLVILGVAALVLPGPGLLGLFAGLAVLSQQYEWAERRVEPVKAAAYRASAESVQSWPRIAISLAGVVALIAWGIFWGIGSDAPGWWPVKEKYWLIGGWGTGATIIVSALIALAMIVYSFKNFRNVEDPEGLADRTARGD